MKQVSSMRVYTFIGLLIVGILTIIVSPDFTQGQPGGGGNRFGGSPFGGGGFRGGFGGGGSGGMMMNDPNGMVEFLSKGRPFFMITETRSLRDPLMQYAQQKGITNGQITRQQFMEFSEQMKAKMGGGMAPPGMKGMGAPGGMMPSPQQSLDAIYQLADSDFKQRDTNGDGKLNADEMPAGLKDSLAKWDTNKDGLIDQTEYRIYFASILQGTAQDPNAQKQAAPIATIIVEEEDWDRKPTVLRAGKLPKD